MFSFLDDYGRDRWFDGRVVGLQRRVADVIQQHRMDLCGFRAGESGESKLSSSRYRVHCMDLDHENNDKTHY